MGAAKLTRNFRLAAANCLDAEEAVGTRALRGPFDARCHCSICLCFAAPNSGAGKTVRFDLSSRRVGLEFYQRICALCALHRDSLRALADMSCQLSVDSIKDHTPWS